MNQVIKKFLKRTAWGTLLALFLIFLFHNFTVNDEYSFKGIKSVLAPLWIIFLINFLFQGLLWLDSRLDRSFPWYDYPKKRLLIEIAIAWPVSLIILSFNYFFLVEISSGPISDDLNSHQRFLYTYIIMMIVLVIAISIVIASNFFKNWRQSLLEVEKLKQEKMKSDYQALQDQLNPHFLFNNFNMLISEIRRDPENAVLIAEKLSDVYRYVLESKNRETVLFREEIEFARTILFLHKARFGENLIIEERLSEKIMEKRIPPLTLQIVIENALKHNIVSVTQPLKIRMESFEDILLVSNPIQPRKSTYSTGLGLKNIKMRYAFLTKKQLRIEVENNQFMVKIPLLD